MYLGENCDGFVAIKQQVKAEVRNYGVDAVESVSVIPERDNMFVFDCQFIVKVISKYMCGQTHQIIIQVVLVTEYLHSINIIHDDISQSNILDFASGRVKVRDFHFGIFASDSLCSEKGR